MTFGSGGSGSGSATLIERKLRLRRGREKCAGQSYQKDPPFFFLYFTDGRLDQRESMGLLEYQAMPSLRDVAHDGVLCTFSNRSASDRGKWCGPSGQAAWTVHHVKITPCWVTLLQAGRRVGPALQPSASLGLKLLLARVSMPAIQETNRCEQSTWICTIIKIQNAPCNEGNNDLNFPNFLLLILFYEKILMRIP